MKVNEIEQQAVELVRKILPLWHVDLSVDSPQGWRQLYWQQARHSLLWHLKHFLKKIFFHNKVKSHPRNQSKIIGEYDRQWGRKSWAKYNVANYQKISGSAWQWQDKKFRISNEGGAAVRLAFLHQFIGDIKPKRVLEIGFGNGINLSVLSTLHPSVEFSGVEPTKSGFSSLEKVISRGKLPDDLNNFLTIPTVDAEAVNRISIYNASGASLPFENKEFDLVMTSLALEQMEEIRDEALKEIARVSSKHVLMLEPFFEMNSQGVRRAYVTAGNYFQGAISDLSSYGLQVEGTIVNLPTKAWLGTALVHAKVVD